MSSSQVEIDELEIQEKRIIQIPKECEFRFELDLHEVLYVKLIEGRAELIGMEIGNEKWIKFFDECRSSIYSFKGCTIALIGMASTEYISNETPLTAYLNLHLAFEQRRIKSRLQHKDYNPHPEIPNERIPNNNFPINVDSSSSAYRVMIVGQEDSGKSTLTKTLLK